MASRSLNFYTGMCNNIVKRVKDHKESLIEGFTKRYKINRLVYYESSQYINNTINREKQIKNGHAQRKSR
jgi:putative endonuclease